LEGKTSDELPRLVYSILKSYKIEQFYYVNSPGSYMAIKVAYTFLKTLSIVKGVPLKACSGFCFNDNSPIKAIGKKYFKKVDDGIIVESLNDEEIKKFKLPKKLDISVFKDDNLPEYNLSAVE
jgi:tRNA A37 threonylcarbamoyladenosine modification protein TsaB